MSEQEQQEVRYYYLEARKTCPGGHTDLERTIMTTKPDFDDRITAAWAFVVRELSPNLNEQIQITAFDLIDDPVSIDEEV